MAIIIYIRLEVNLKRSGDIALKTSRDNDPDPADTVNIAP